MRFFRSLLIYLKSRESSSAKQVMFAFFLSFWSSSFKNCFDHRTSYNFFWCSEWVCLCNTVISGVHLYETSNRLLALERYGDWLPKSLYIENNQFANNLLLRLVCPYCLFFEFLYFSFTKESITPGFKIDTSVYQEWHENKYSLTLSLHQCFFFVRMFFLSTGDTSLPSCGAAMW